mgnify:FL=1
MADEEEEFAAAAAAAAAAAVATVFSDAMHEAAEVKPDGPERRLSMLDAREMLGIEDERELGSKGGGLE